VQAWEQVVFCMLGRDLGAMTHGYMIGWGLGSINAPLVYIAVAHVMVYLCLVKVLLFDQFGCTAGPWCLSAACRDIASMKAKK